MMTGIKGLKDKVGAVWRTQTYEIEKGMLRRFARAVGDTNPLWQDEGYARKAGYGSIISPPTFMATLGLEQIQQLLVGTPDETSLHGSTELESYQPVRAGDVITANTIIADFRQRTGKATTMTFVTFDITYENQQGELVGRCRHLIINY